MPDAHVIQRSQGSEQSRHAGRERERWGNTIVLRNSHDKGIDATSLQNLSMWIGQRSRVCFILFARDEQVNLYENELVG
jgi:hypothetical protein